MTDFIGGLAIAIKELVPRCYQFHAFETKTRHVQWNGCPQMVPSRSKVMVEVKMFGTHRKVLLPSGA